MIDDEPAGFIGFEVTTYGGTGSDGGESETMGGGEAKMESSVLATVDVGLIERDEEVEGSFIAIEEDIRGFAHAGLGETTDGVKEEVGVDPDFNEVGGVIGVFQASGFTGLLMPPFEPLTFCSKGDFPPVFWEIQAVDPGTGTGAFGGGALVCTGRGRQIRLFVGSSYGTSHHTGMGYGC